MSLLGERRGKPADAMRKMKRTRRKRKKRITNLPAVKRRRRFLRRNAGTVEKRSQKAPRDARNAIPVRTWPRPRMRRISNSPDRMMPG